MKAFSIILPSHCKIFTSWRRAAAEVCEEEHNPQSSPELMEAVLAFATMFGGFLAMLNETGGIDANCKYRIRGFNVPTSKHKQKH